MKLIIFALIACIAFALAAPADDPIPPAGDPASPPGKGPSPPGKEPSPPGKGPKQPGKHVPFAQDPDVAELGIKPNGEKGWYNNNIDVQLNSFAFKRLYISNILIFILSFSLCAQTKIPKRSKA